MGDRPPDAETLTAISKGIKILSGKCKVRATSLTTLALASDAAKAAGIKPVRDVQDPAERLKACLVTQKQAEAILGLLRYWYSQMKGKK